MLEKIKYFYNETKITIEKFQIFEEKQVWPISWLKIFFKTYPRFPQIELPLELDDTELLHLLLKRESRRNYKDKLVSFNVIANIIYLSVGIKDNKKNINETRRFYPSAGARYPIETYLISNNIKDLTPGLYHYNVKANTLEMILEKNMRKNCLNIFGEEISKKYPNFIILTGVMSRTEVKYGINAYRFALLECGHIGQNISLLSESMDVGCCAIGGFDNDNLVKLLDLTKDEIPLYCFALGVSR